MGPGKLMNTVFYVAKSDAKVLTIISDNLNHVMSGRKTKAIRQRANAEEQIRITQNSFVIQYMDDIKWLKKEYGDYGVKNVEAIAILDIYYTKLGKMRGELSTKKQDRWMNEAVSQLRNNWRETVDETISSGYPLVAQSVYLAHSRIQIEAEINNN